MEPVKEAIKKLYSTLETQLDVEELIGKLMSAGLAGLMLRHEVQRRPTKIDKNRAILDNLQYYLPKELRSFCDVLSTCSPPMGPELAQKISDCLDDELGEFMMQGRSPSFLMFYVWYSVNYSKHIITQENIKDMNTKSGEP